MPSLPPNRAVSSTPPHIPSTDPHHSLYPTSPFPLPNRATPTTHPTIPSIELRFHPLTFAPFLQRDTIASAHLRPSFSALIPSLLCTNTPTVAHHRALSYQGGGAVVRWGRSGCPIQTDRCSHAVRGDVRRHHKKVYRVSEKSL